MRLITLIHVVTMSPVTVQTLRYIWIVPTIKSFFLYNISTEGTAILI